MFFNKKADYKTLQQAAETRRSVYALNRSLPLPAAEVSAWQRDGGKIGLLKEKARP